MLGLKSLIAAGLLTAVASAPALAEGDDVRSLDRRFREVAARSIPATVLVKSTLADGSGRSGFGSGATISADGYILTCAHVVDMAGDVEVTLASGETFPARVVGKNPKQDYALLKVEIAGLPCFKLGDDRRLALGDWVIALGHPGGPYPDLKPAFSVGRVTGLHRRLPVQMMDRFYDDAIRTDAPIFAGNSGGPLISLDGELIGLNGAILLINENSYAVPMHEIQAHLDQLKRGESVEGRSPQGMGATPMEEFQGRDLAKFLGRAGRRLLGKDGLGKLIPGEGPQHDEIARMLDRIGKSLESDRAQQTIENLFEAFGGGGGGGGGETPKMPDLSELRKRAEEFLGGGNGETPSVKDLLDRLRGEKKGEPEERAETPAAPPVFLGITAAPDAGDISGVRVANVTEGGPAAKAGLKRGDVIVAVGTSRILAPDDLGSALTRRSPGDVVALKILRERTVAGVPIYDERSLEAKLAARSEGK